MLIINKPIILVGMMGVGKTSFGKRLAKNMKISFFDLDCAIEKEEEMSVSDIFASKGEKYFRHKEYEILNNLLNSNNNCIIALGGGAFVDNKTREIIRQKAISVWVKAGIDILLKRVSQNNKRPLLENGNKKEILMNLLKEREIFYSQADIEIINDDTPHQYIEEIFFRKLEEYAKTQK